MRKMHGNIALNDRTKAFQSLNHQLGKKLEKQFISNISTREVGRTGLIPYTVWVAISNLTKYSYFRKFRPWFEAARPNSRKDPLL